MTVGPSTTLRRSTAHEWPDLQRALAARLDPADVAGRRFLADTRPVAHDHGHYGSDLWVLDDADGPVSYNLTAIHRTRQGAWGRYCNFYAAFTLTDHRRLGHASAVLAAVEADAVGDGCARLKSLVSTWEGLCLHLAAGHHVWGRNARDELVVDTPLRPGNAPTRGVPRLCRAGNIAPRLHGPDDLNAWADRHGAPPDRSPIDRWRMTPA